MQRAETAAAKLLQLLPLTPVSAVGINFVYTEDPTPANIASIFNTSDLALIGRAGFDVRASALSRNLSFEDRELRVRLTLTEQNNLRITLNFHKKAGTGALAREAIIGKSLGYLAAGQRILQQVYDLRLEEVGQ